MADEPLSKTQLDKLGDRLRAGSRDEADLRALDEYRRSFRKAFDRVIDYFSSDLELDCTGRPAKSTTSIIEKLNRQNIRLTQIQDVAGFRVVVKNILEQNRTVQSLSRAFRQASIDDRRQKPSHGYRAVHVIVETGERWVEVQVRTHEQHLWAELSEKLSDVIDPNLKYGGGPSETRSTLLEYSRFVAEIEALEVEDLRSALELAGHETRFERVSLEDPSWQDRLDLLNQLRSSQYEAEAGTRRVKRSLAGLLTAYYNELRHKP